MPKKIVIVVRGGVVNNVYSPDPNDTVDLIDFDVFDSEETDYEERTEEGCEKILEEIQKTHKDIL